MELLELLKVIKGLRWKVAMKSDLAGQYLNMMQLYRLIVMFQMQLYQILSWNQILKNFKLIDIKARVKENVENGAAASVNVSSLAQRNGHCSIGFWSKNLMESAIISCKRELQIKKVAY